MRSSVVVFALVLAVSLSGCRQSSTAPSSSGAPSGTPVILGTVPTQPALNNVAQTVQVNGHDFENGMTATITRPDGGSVPFLSSELRQLTSSSFQILLTLDVAGTYRIELRNTNGQTSAPYSLPVGGAAQGFLTLTSVTPATTVAAPQPQAIFVSGANFDASLEAILTGPDSVMNFYPSAAMAGLTSTSFTLNVIFDRVGTYTLVVRNSSNSTSNAATIDVRRTF